MLMRGGQIPQVPDGKPGHDRLIRVTFAAGQPAMNPVVFSAKELTPVVAAQTNG
jgi:hypothetical protein